MDLIKLHCSLHSDRLVDRFCLTLKEFICGKCITLSDTETRKVSKKDLELCIERVNELLRERMLEIVKENPNPTQQLKHILTLQD